MRRWEQRDWSVVVNPEGQKSQTEEEEGAAVPEGQGVQTEEEIADGSELKVPAGHGVHAKLFVSDL
jgi:hypothetical protein